MMYQIYKAASDTHWTAYCLGETMKGFESHEKALIWVVQKLCDRLYLTEMALVGRNMNKAIEGDSPNQQT